MKAREGRMHSPRRGAKGDKTGHFGACKGKVDGREKGVSQKSPPAPAAGKQAPALPSVDLEAGAAHLSRVHLTLLAAVPMGPFSAQQAAVPAAGGAELLAGAPNKDPAHGKHTTILQKQISKFEELVHDQTEQGISPRGVCTRAWCHVSCQTVSKLKPH